MKIDYQNNDYDFITSFYGAKEVFPLLLKAVETDLFDAISQYRPWPEIQALLGTDEVETGLFLDVLCHAGLIARENGCLFTTPVTEKYLVKTSPFYCGGLLKSDAVNGVFLAERLAPLLGEAGGRCGLETDFPIGKTAMAAICPALTFTQDTPYDLLFSGHLGEAEQNKIAAGGIIVICGRFLHDYGLGGAVNRYRTYLAEKRDCAVDDEALSAFCRERKLCRTPRLSLSDDFSVVFASKNPKALKKLSLTPTEQLIGTLKNLAIHSVKQIDPADVVSASWVKDHCRFGCAAYGGKCCPPHSPNYEETQTRLKDYTKALLIEGQPPTRDFQRLMLKAEKTAFKAGFYKAFAYWAGPCSLCSECKPPAPPKKCTATRPSMESAGIDVFATVHRQGYAIKTLQEKTEFIKYFGLLLLE